MVAGLVAIDPGLNSMGWAYWPGPRVDMVKRSAIDLTPTKVGLIKAPRGLELAPRALWVAEQLRGKLPQVGGPSAPPGFGVDFVSEYPEWMNIRLGWAAGDLQKLVFLVGALAGYFSDAHSFSLVKPSEWKGQLPKVVVKKRLTKRFGPGATREWEKDIWDAVGIGLWKMNRF